jgi:hypothetical protein
MTTMAWKRWHVQAVHLTAGQGTSCRFFLEAGLALPDLSLTSLEP